MASIALMVLKYAVPTAAIMFGERYVLNEYGGALGTLGGDAVVAVPRLYGLVLLTNVVASTFTLVYLSMKVGMARKKFEVELPCMYSPEKTKAAVQFNCVQRGHQQALETYTSFALFSLIGGLRHPLVTSAMGLLWMVSRVKWAEGYATGDPQNRYGHSQWGRHIWTAFIGTFVCATSTSLTILGLL